MFLYIILPVLTIAGLVLLLLLAFRIMGDLQKGNPVEKYAVRLGVVFVITFVCLFRLRLAPVAAVLLLIFLAFLVLVAFWGRPRKAAPPSKESHLPARLVSLEKYAKHIREKAVVKRILRLQGLVGSIRAVAGYDARTLAGQPADVIKLESVYLPRIDDLLGQYLKVSKHDAAYSPHSLMESLDQITGAVKRIYDNCLSSDKLSIDVEASALLSAMRMDGLAPDENMILPSRAKEKTKEPS